MINMPMIKCVESSVRPLAVQDGGWEIHPLLRGITFKFWRASDLNRGSEKQVFVNYEGDSEKAPWAYALTGGVYNSFGEAKGALRKGAWASARAEGFKFNPEEHGYRWM